MSLKADIDRGVVIVAELAKLTKELKEIEERVKAHAKERSDKHVPLKDADREGRMFEAHGSNIVVPVVFTADKLVGSFQKDSKEHLRIASALCTPETAAHFPAFFAPWSGFENALKDGQQFRRRAAELLGDAAPAFIRSCISVGAGGIPKSDIKIEWKTAAAEQKLGELASA